MHTMGGGLNDRTITYARGIIESLMVRTRRANSELGFDKDHALIRGIVIGKR